MPQIDISIKTAADLKGFADTVNSARELKREARDLERSIEQVQRKFSAGDFLKEGLRGIGIASGFQAIEKSLELVTDQMRKNAEYAKLLEERANGVAEAFQRAGAALFGRVFESKGPQEQLELLKNKNEEITRQMREQETIRENALAAIGKLATLGRGEGFTDTVNGVDFAFRGKGGRVIGGTRVQDAEAVLNQQSEEAQKKAQELKAQLEDNAKQVITINKAIDESAKSDAEKLAKTENALAKGEIENALAADEINKRSDAAAEASLDAQADKWISLNNYLLQYRLDLAEIEKVYSKGKLTADEYGRAIEEAGKKRDAAQHEDINQRLTGFFGEAEPRSKNRESDKSLSQRSAEAYGGLGDSTQHYQNGEGVTAGLQNFLTRVGTMADQVASAIEDTLGSAVDAITEGIDGWLTGAQSFGQAISGIGLSVLRAMEQQLVRIGVQWLINQALVKTGMISIEALQDTQRAQRVVKENAAEAATLPAKTAGAAAAGISSFGLALIFGALAVALIVAAASGFEEGGYTAAGASNKPAGIVHAGEWVAPAWMVNDSGYGPLIDGLESARRGMPGFEIGGYVSPGQYLTPPAYEPRAGSSGGGTQNHYFLFDRQEWSRMMQEDSEGWFHDMSAKRERA